MKGGCCEVEAVEVVLESGGGSPFVVLSQPARPAPQSGWTSILEKAQLPPHLSSPSPTFTQHAHSPHTPHPPHPPPTTTSFTPLHTRSFPLSPPSKDAFVPAENAAPVSELPDARPSASCNAFTASTRYVLPLLSIALANPNQPQYTLPHRHGHTCHDQKG